MLREEEGQIVSQTNLIRSLSQQGHQDSSSSFLVETSDNDSQRTLGTLKGVFAPVSLSMFSVLLFLRVGYIVGNAGFLETLLQFSIAFAILVATVLSICAIATNGAVKGGGVYFMLSRTLGPEVGGSVGILFYFANVVGSSLNVTACVEGVIANVGPLGSVAKIIPASTWWHFLYCSIFNLANFVLCLIGAELFGKVSALILVLVFCCCLAVISSFFRDTSLVFPYTMSINNATMSINGTFHGLAANNLDGVYDLISNNLYPNYSMDCHDHDAPAPDFFTVFGVLFSGVTGIMAGANISGELKMPSKSIPRGTLSACAFTYLTFVILSLLTSLTCNRALLQHDCIYMNEFVVWNGATFIGLVLATWSASLSNLIGASRLIQAVAKDAVFGSSLDFILKGTFRSNPMAAVTISWILVQLMFFVGDLNRIAQLCSVLFLLSYASVNLACLGLELASAPNFRPTFNYFSWHTCSIGLIGTSLMMFFVSPLFAAIAIMACLIIILILHYFSPVARDSNWGSISQALIFHQVRKYLLMLDIRKSHIKFWRPQILLLVHNPRTACALVDFVNSMKKGGLYVLGHVTEGDLETCQCDPTAQEYSDWLGLVDHLKVKAFVEVTMAERVRKGIEQMVRISGIGAMKPNTILLGFRDDTKHVDELQAPNSTYSDEKFLEYFKSIKKNTKISPEEFVGVIEDTLKLEKNIGLCRGFQKLNTADQVEKKRYLDVWPVNFLSGTDTDIRDNTSLFLLQLACIVNMADKWSNHELRVFMCTSLSSEEDIRKKDAELRKLLHVLRINAKTCVLVWDHLAMQLQRRHDHDDGLSSEFSSVTPLYLTEANAFIQSKCDDTAVSFIYLPRPPPQADRHASYLEQLEILTRELPPTILVHGVNPVITTTL